MATLKSRQMQIPNGFKYSIPELRWKSPQFISFDEMVNQVLSIARANPSIQSIPQTREQAESAVEQYNVKICQDNGWNDYVHDPENSPPKWFPPSQASRYAGRLAAGAKTLTSWIGDGAEPVSKELSASRASVCSKCPMNKPGEIGNFFERAAAELIRRQVEFAKECELSTPHDDRLGVCSGCGCPLHLKVHVPLAEIRKNMAYDSFQEYAAGCWIVDEVPSIATVSTQTFKPKQS